METREGHTRAIAAEVLGAGSSGEALKGAARLVCQAAGALFVELTMQADGRLAVVRHGEPVGGDTHVIRAGFGNVQLIAAITGGRADAEHLVDMAALALHARFSDQSANIDALTGVHNRAALERRLERGAACAIAIIDVDHFKNYNDTYGHPAGDAVLRRVAHAISASLQGPNDFFARYGGEEFVALIDGCAAQHSIAVAERMRIAVRSLNIPHAAGKGGRVTVSIGLAQGTGASREKAALAAADDQLYRAKLSGRDRVCAEGYLSDAHAAHAGSRSMFLPLCGYASQVREIVRALAPGRAITITGSAGIGKTRLALHASGLAALAYAKVVFIDAWSLIDGDELARRAAQVAAVNVLVVIDGCEHLPDAVQRAIEAITAAQGAAIVTARTRIGFANEIVISLSGLDTNNAAALFRTASVEGGALVQQSDVWIANVVRRTSGVPAHLIMLGSRAAEAAPSQLLSEAAAVRWERESLHDLLEAALDAMRGSRGVLASLAVFAAGATCADIACIAGIEETHVREQVAALVEAGVAAHDDGVYAISAPLREAVFERHEWRDERTASARRHVAWCLAQFTALDAAQGRVENAAFISTIAPYMPDVELALRRALMDRELTPQGMSLCAQAHRYWSATAKQAESERWCHAFLDTGRGQDRARAELFLNLAGIAYMSSRWNDARAYAQAGLDLAGVDSRSRGRALNYLGIVAKQRLDAKAARAYFQEYLEVARAASNFRGETVAIGALGSVSFDLDVDFDAALALFSEGARRMREIGDDYNAIIEETNVVECLVNVGRVTEARELVERLLNETAACENDFIASLVFASAASVADAMHDHARLREILQRMIELLRIRGDALLQHVFQIAGDTYWAAARREEALTMYLAGEWVQIRDGAEVLPIERYHHARRFAQLGVDAKEHAAVHARLREIPTDDLLAMATDALTTTPRKR